MASIHKYPVSVNWLGGKEGSGSVKASTSGLESPLAVGVEFQGTGKGTNPEELLTSAIASCYSMTFGIIAQNRKIPVTGMQVEAVGEVEQNGAMLTYTAITVRPSISLEATATDEQVKLAEDMAHKA